MMQHNQYVELLIILKQVGVGCIQNITTLKKRKTKHLLSNGKQRGANIYCPLSSLNLLFILGIHDATQSIC
jgi:hypothetical protein